MSTDAITSRSVASTQIVMVCAKCTRKLKGGFGRKRKHSLRAMLRVALNEAGQRRSVRVVETGCLSLCPKRAVTVLNSARPGEMLSIAQGTPIETVMERLVTPLVGPGGKTATAVDKNGFVHADAVATPYAGG